jgi:hypothetical protein
MPERQQYHDTDEPASARHETHINGSHKVKAVCTRIHSPVPPAAILTRFKLQNSGADDPG